MRERWVVVEEAFRARGPGVLVSPKFAPVTPPPNPFPVTLKLPDGRERDTTAHLEFAHIRGSLPPFAMFRLVELAPEDVPAGTEIWVDVTPAVAGG